MKVWHVLHGFPPETSGGTEAVVEALARAMQAEGHDVTVVAGSLHLGDPAAPDLEDASGLPVVRMHRDDLYYETWFKTWSPALSCAFRARLARERPDVVHVHHWLRLSSDLARSARAAGCVVAVTCHDYFAALARPVRRVGEDVPEPPAAPGYVGPAEVREAFAFHRRDFADELRAAHLRYAPSAAQARGLEALLHGDPGPFAVAPMPRVAPALPRLSARTPRGRRLLTWGTLYPEKGIESVLEALARLPPSLGWTLTVLGEAHDPDFRDAIETRARGLPVEWRGRFAPADLARCDADFALLPSLADESYGLVLDEALQLGLPMVAADVPAYRERAPSGACAFYPPGDAAALADLLARPVVLDRLRAPDAPRLPEPSQAAAALLADYRRALAQPPAQYVPSVTDGERAEMLFRRAERRFWTALQQARPPAPPDDLLAPPSGG